MTHECPWCGGLVYDAFDAFDGCCSEICQKIAAGTHWPTPVGPATHDEIVGWIKTEEATKRAREAAAERERARLAEEAAETERAHQAAWDAAVAAAADEEVRRRIAEITGESP